MRHNNKSGTFVKLTTMIQSDQPKCVANKRQWSRPRYYVTQLVEPSGLLPSVEEPEACYQQQEGVQYNKSTVVRARPQFSHSRHFSVEYEWCKYHLNLTRHQTISNRNWSLSVHGRYIKKIYTMEPKPMFFFSVFPYIQTTDK